MIGEEDRELAKKTATAVKDQTVRLWRLESGKSRDFTIGKKEASPKIY